MIKTSCLWITLAESQHWLAWHTWRLDYIQCTVLVLFLEDEWHRCKFIPGRAKMSDIEYRHHGISWKAGKLNCSWAWRRIGKLDSFCQQQPVVYLHFSCSPCSFSSFIAGLQNWSSLNTTAFDHLIFFLYCDSYVFELCFIGLELVSVYWDDFKC